MTDTGPAIRDLLDFEGETLYFDVPLVSEAAQAIEAAREEQDAAQAEALLLRASALAPDHLSVIVALYRSYYFWHRHEDALRMAERAMNVCARRLQFPADWRTLTPADIARGAEQSMTTTRFYLWALKGAGYLLMRLDRLAEALDRLDKLCSLDPHDRLGAEALANLARERLTSHNQPERV